MFEVVTLTCPSLQGAAPREPLECYVLAVARRTIALQLREKQLALRLPAAMSGVIMSVERGSALVALRGNARVMPSPVGDLRFVIEGGDSANSLGWQPTRLALSAPITVVAGGSEVEGVICEVSCAGEIAIEGPIAARVGDLVVARFTLPDLDPAVVDARVVESGAGRLTVELVGKASEAVRQGLASLIVGDNRSKLRRRMHGETTGPRPEF